MLFRFFIITFASGNKNPHEIILIYIKYKLLIILFLLVGANAFASGQKYALLVGISKYQKGTDWNNISGTNDVDLLEPTLREQGFNILSLRNSEATHMQIIQNIAAITSKAKKGDIVYLHFSGHGQAVEDITGDEKDGWDEAFIPYDAAKSYSKSYTGKNHLLDDELGKCINKLRAKLGPKGMLYVVVDACHSGTMDRDVATPTRGTRDAFVIYPNKVHKEMKREKQIHYPLVKDKKYSKIIMLEACGAEETNQEIAINGKYYGPLSYSVYETIVMSGLNASQTWVDKVRANMGKLHINHKQRMIDQVAL